VVRAVDGARWNSGPGILATAYHEIRTRVTATVEGHEEAVARLSLMAVRHLHLGGRQRALLIGPSGAGKTTLLVAVAHALDCPMALWDVSVSSEAGWSGVGAPALLAELYQACDGDLERMSRAIWVLDEIDKVAIRDATGSSREYRRGQQKSLLGLLGGGTLTRFQSDGDRGVALSVRTDDMLIVGAGAFEGLPPDPTPGDLVAYGYLVEFASRFSVLISLQPLDRSALARVLVRELAPILESAAEFGYQIRVGRPVLHYVAGTLQSSGSITPRAAMGWLQAAVDRVVLRLLDLEAPVGTQYDLSPDDIPVPAAIRGGPKRRES
jgi:ATP-dependent protease Clp ATPase subunit